MANFETQLSETLQTIENDGLLKRERPLASPQGAHIDVGGREMLNLCANNYLGLADHPQLIAAAKGALETHGFGMASVRFICGTHEIHRALEQELAAFLGMEDSILYAACFDANGGLFEPLLGPDDAIVSDALNHASIIDGVRLCKAARYRYANADMDDLEAKLKDARANGAQQVMIATDGVFSMDGFLAPLADIRVLADRYDALIMVDDCHATGFMGPQGRGTPAHHGVTVDILTGTLGKALGGAIGGYTAASTRVVELLRQRSRPYLFSNALPPMVVEAGREALRIVHAGDDLRARLFENTSHWRTALEAAGFRTLPGSHPIVPVMLGDARLAQDMAAALFARGVYVSGFFFPVVPKGEARIRTQMNAALTRDDLDKAAEAFVAAGRETGALS